MAAPIQNQNRSFSLLKDVLLHLLPIALLAGVLLLQIQRLNAFKDETEPSITQLEQQVQAIASSVEIAQRLPSLGFDALIADWFFLRFLQYFGDDAARAETGYSLSPAFFRVIIPNDPYYRMFYLFLSGSTSNFAAQPEQSVAIIAQGLERLSPTLPEDSFYIWQYRGVDELLYLGDAEAAQKSYRIAADWARQSSHPDAPYVAENAQRTADFLARNPLSKQAQINAWANVLGNAFDAATRQRAIDRIKELGGSVLISETGEVSIQFPQDD